MGDGKRQAPVKPTGGGGALPTPWIATQCRQEPIADVPTGPSTRGQAMAVTCKTGPVESTVAVACESGEADSEVAFGSVKVGDAVVTIALFCRTEMGGGVTL